MCGPFLVPAVAGVRTGSPCLSATEGKEFVEDRALARPSEQHTRLAAT
jgi:hypothetical protein